MKRTYKSVHIAFIPRFEGVGRGFGRLDHPITLDNDRQDLRNWYQYHASDREYFEGVVVVAESIDNKDT